MRKRLKSVIYTRSFAALVYGFVRLYSRTFRFRVVNEAAWKEQVTTGHPVLLCGWHQQFFPAIRHFKTYSHFSPGLMISRSKDGELIAGVARRTGWRTVRGSSSRGGKAAMAAMIDHIRAFGMGAHILDGPRGPMGTVKAGAIKIAQETGARVVPFQIRAESAWLFNSWDRFMLPRPFSRVTLSFGEMLRFPPTTTAGDFEAQRRFLETTMQPWLVWKKT